MTKNIKQNNSPMPEQAFELRNFDIRTLQDEIKADQRCEQLMETFFHHMVSQKSLEPSKAGILAKGADFFLRDFIISERRENIFSALPHRVLQFAGNWYIIKTLEPNMKELGEILDGIKHFYGFCIDIGKTSPEQLQDIVQNCDKLDYYKQRIDSFWEIEDDGYFAWDRECSLKD